MDYRGFFNSLESSNRRLLITGGPTCEDIDAVRFLNNRSTGAMGVFLAEAAAARGWRAALILGPTHLAPADGIACLRVRSAEEMRQAVLAGLEWCQALVMAAAVADYTPAEPFSGKMKKGEGELLLRLKRTRDILQDVAVHPARAGKTVIGFALETTLDLAEARRKLEAKNLDAIVANTSESFGGEFAEACLLRRGGETKNLGRIAKRELARVVVAEAEAGPGGAP